MAARPARPCCGISSRARKVCDTPSERDGAGCNPCHRSSSPRHSARYRAGVFFVGNIAGEAHPIIAEGISMAIQSAGCWRGANRGRPARGRDTPATGYDNLRHASMPPRFCVAGDERSSRTTAARLIRAYPSILTVGARLSGKTDLAVTRPERSVRSDDAKDRPEHLRSAAALTLEICKDRSDIQVLAYWRG